MENEGTSPAATSETPTPLNVAEAPWEEVRAAARRGLLDAVEVADGDATEADESGAATPDGAAEARAIAAGAPADRQTEGQPAASDATSQGKPDADPERLAASLRGNIKQLQDLRQRDQDALAALQQQHQQLQQQWAGLQREREEQQYLQAIQSQVARMPEEYRAPAVQQALEEHRQQRGLVERQRQLEGYAGYLGQQAQQLEAQRFQTTVQQLPHAMEDFASFVAEATQAPVEPLRELVRSDAFRNVYTLVQRQQDVPLAMQIAGEILGAVAHQEATRETARKEQNRQAAVETGAYRAEGGGGIGGDRTLTQKIETMSPDDFRAYRERVRKSRSLQR